MANVITKQEYLTIAGYLADVRELLDRVSTYLYSAANVVVTNDSFNPTLDLPNAFINTYLAQTSALDSNSPYLEMVRVLNNHVLRRGGHATIDEFLASSETPGASYVDQNWADMCSDAGFTVTRVS